jgi:exosortase
MSATHHLKQHHHDQIDVEPKAGRDGIWSWLTLCLVASSYAPLITAHILDMLSRPHYQYVLVVPIAAWGLWSISDDTNTSPSILFRWQWPIALVTLVSAFVILGVASWYWSPWAAMFSLLLASLPMLLWYGRSNAIHRGFRAWIFCWVLLPLPFGMDEDVTLGLRGLATQMTSAVLDQMGILHLCYANVIEVPSKSLFVADACSGINSLFVLFACALFVAMWFQRGVLHTVILLVATIALVMIENTTRLLSVVVGLEWQIDLSEGWEHQALGGLLFLISVGLVFSMDQLIRYLIGNNRPPHGEIRIHSNPSDDTGPRKTFVVIACCFPFLAAVQLWHAAQRDTSQMPGLWQADIRLNEFGADALPNSLAGFERVDFKTIERVAGDPLGRSSQQWTFRRGFTTAVVSLDYPYDGIHDLCVCYSQIGWNIEHKRVLSTDDLMDVTEDIQSPAAIGLMTRSMHGNALLLFSLCDTQGRMGAVIKELARGTSLDRMMARAGVRQANSDNGVFDKDFGPPPYLQFQLLARTHEELDQEKIDALTNLFIGARRLLRERCLEDLAQPKETR